MARGDQARADRRRADALAERIAFAQRNALFCAVGTILATLALVLGVLALNATITGAADSASLGWVITLLVCAGVLGLVCVVQQRLWNLAWRRWSSEVPTSRVERLSWVLHLVSYPVVVIGIFAGIAAAQQAGLTSAVSTWSTAALVPLVAAQVLGAVQHVRPGGPPGTIPTYVRRLAARIERSRHED